jgi:glycolate oxidase FAD binding subunit
MLGMTENESFSAKDWQKLVAVGSLGAASPPETRLVFPTAAELPELVKSVAGERLLVAGSGSKLAWGRLVQKPTMLVSTQKLDRLIDHATGDLTVTVEAGMPFQRLQDQLANAHQFLPLDPLFPEQATIGGIIATADTGSFRQRYGGVRDLLLGISWVRADGLVAKAGGRVVKNVAGYDLMKLFTGSYGTLGILQQVTLRVYPRPSELGGVWVTGSLTMLRELGTRLGQMALTPTAWDLVSGPLAQQLGLGDKMGILARFQAIPSSIAAQSDRLISLAQELGAAAEFLNADRCSSIWAQLRPACQGAILVKVGLRASRAVEIMAGVDGPGLVHLGSGIGLVGLSDPEQILPLRAQCEAAGGYLSVLLAPPALKASIDVWGQPAATLQLNRQLRQQFDPTEMFNPGKFFAP